MGSLNSPFTIKKRLAFVCMAIVLMGRECHFAIRAGADGGIGNMKGFNLRRQRRAIHLRHSKEINQINILSF